MIQALEAYWHQLSWLEVIAVVTGLLCVYLAARNNIWNWPVAIVSTVITIYVMARSALYADMLQYSYLTIINIYGWYVWSKRKSTDEKRPVVHISRRQVVWTLAAVIIITPALGFMLITFAGRLHYQPPAYPYLDSFCTVVSLSAQVLLARKALENWLIWVFVDIIYVVIYSLKGLEAYAFMFVVYIVLAILGFIDWKRDYRKQLSNQIS